MISDTTSVQTATPEDVLTPPITTTKYHEDSYQFPESLPVVELGVELFYSERWMRVTQQVVLQNTTDDAWDEVVFDVPINAVGDLFFLDEVVVTQGESEQQGVPGFLTGENILAIPLPHPLEPGDAVTIVMRYRVIIPPVSPIEWPPSGTTGWTATLIQAGEWYPALVPYREGEGWVRWNYHPVGDPTFYPLTHVSLRITTEEDVLVVSSGLVENVGTTWVFEQPNARGIAFFASPQYQHAERNVDGIPVTTYYLPEHEQAGLDTLDIAEDSLILFTELYGPYPYDGLVIVENGFFGGMEYSGLISITDYAYFIYNDTPNSVLHALVSHEVAHQWWYGAVGNDQINEAWLDEALAFYSEYLYYENLYPGFTDWWWEARVYQFDRYGPVDASIYSYAESSEFILSMYGQAAVFLHDLRARIGDEVFFAFLQGYYQTYYGQTVTGEDFFDLLREYTDHDLKPLLEAYFADTDL